MGLPTYPLTGTCSACRAAERRLSLTAQRARTGSRADGLGAMGDDGPMNERGSAGPTWPTPPAAGAPPEPPPSGPVGGAWSFDGPVGELAPNEVPVTPRALTLSIATVTTALLVSGASLVSLPYAVNSPGPTFDTLGEHDGTALIDVVGAPTYASEGELRFTTVRLRGGPGNPVSLVRLVTGWFDDTVTVVPVEDVLPTDQTSEEIDELNQAAMISSQENATVSALEELGYEVPTTLTVAETIEGTGAAGALEAGDVLLAVDGARLAGFSELSAAMDAVTPGDDVTITVERDGAERDVTLTTTDSGDGRALLGVFVDPVFDLPVDVRIQIDNVGGPSAGLMFSLGIINALTEEDETGGEHIAGTGTMDLTGAVGPIGGIVQKMNGARDDGADWFLAPESNCAEVVGHVPDGLDVVAVATLSEARAAVEAIGSGTGRSLRTCADAVGS